MSSTGRAPVSGATALVAAAALLAGCHGGYGSGSSGSGAGSDVANQTFTGMVAGPGTGDSGTVTMMFGSAPMPGYSMTTPMASTGSISLTATLRTENGQAITLSGSYDPGTRSFTAQGGGFSLSGTVANGVIEGTFTSPAGPGSVVALRGSRAQLTLFCGNYRDTQGADLGVWFLEVSGSVADGDFSASESGGGGHGELRGSVSGSNVNLSVLDSSRAAIGTATGMISGGDASGNWTMGSSSGTWQGSAGSCP